MQLSFGEDDVIEVANIEGILSALEDTRKGIGSIASSGRINRCLLDKGIQRECYAR